MSSVLEEIPPASLTAQQSNRPTTYNDYSPEFKEQTMLLLESNKGNVRKTARESNISEATLRYWIEQENQEGREIRAGVKGEMADAFERVSRIYLDRAIEADAVEKTSGYYAVNAAKEAMVTAQLIRGLPTSISGSVLSDDERKLRLAELILRARERQSDPEPDLA